MGKMTRTRLARMSDDELLAYQRERHGDPYMTLADAKAMRHTDLEFWHLGALKDKAERAAAAEAGRALRAKLFPGTIAMADDDEEEYAAAPQQ